MESLDTLGANASNSLWEIRGKLDYVDDWSLMRTPVHILGIWLTYLVFVLKIGPALMKGRPPFRLTNILVVYNAFQVLISAFLFTEGFKLLWKYGLVQKNYCLTDSAEVERYMMSNFYYYFLAKVSELSETVFFVLRKKYRQVSFLHVYHHSSTVLFSWAIIKFDPSPITIFIGTINSFVHIVMYTYYALSAFPELNKYLWWKKYITKLQLVQFMIIFVMISVDFKYSQCDASYTLLGLILFELAVLIALFTNFYVQSYLKEDKKKTKVDQNGNTIKDGNGSKNDRIEKQKNASDENGNGTNKNGKLNGSGKSQNSGVFNNGPHKKKAL